MISTQGRRGNTHSVPRQRFIQRQGPAPLLFLFFLVILIATAIYPLSSALAQSPAKSTPTSTLAKQPLALSKNSLVRMRQALKQTIHVKHHNQAAPNTAHAATTLTGTAPAYNNTAISDDSSPSDADFDGSGNSYSSQELQDPNGVDWNPGDDLSYNGMDLIWPNVPAGSPDNYQAAGQTIPLSPVANADTIGFVGAATGGPSSGTATISYSDGSTQNFTLGFTDWTLNGFTQSPSYDNRLFASLTRRNTLQGQQNLPVFIFYAEQKLLAGKTAQSITLPSTVNQGQLHVFTIGTRAGNYYMNNVGTTDDASTTFGDYDAPNGSSYSLQTLQNAGITPGQNVTFNGVSFAWPASYSVIPDNYLASGQIIPVTPVANANTLAFLGSSTNGSSSGTATITYTDASTQNFTLGLTDWWSGTPLYNNVPVALLPYINTSTSRLNGSYYLYYAETPLPTGKTIQSVTLPTTVSPGQMHVFAVGTRSGVYYNNTGTSDDNNTTLASFDNGGNSYSAQALQAAGLTPGQTLTYDGIQYSWPTAQSGTFNNYVANGQTIPVTPVANATTLGFLGSSTQSSSSGTATITYTDGSTQAFTLGLSDWRLAANTIQPSFGNGTVATATYSNQASGKLNSQSYIFSAEVTLQTGKTLQSVTLPSSVTPTGSYMHVFAIGTRAASAYNNIGTSDDTQPGTANFDGQGASYSLQALQSVGFSAGQTVLSNGSNFTWPSSTSGNFNNYVANGQTIPVTPVANANTLAFLGSATGGPSSGTATITYTNSTTQTFSLTFSDWTLNAGVATVSAGNQIAATLSYRNTPSGKQNGNTYLFYTDVTLQAGKTVQSVTLPGTVNQGQLHVFAIGTRASSPYSNVGISDDAHPGFGGYDGGGLSYSAQALQNAGLIAGQTVTYNGVRFTWPNVPSGLLDNYQASGQTIPVTPVANANTLAFLGSSTNKASSGTATITYTDGTAQPFTLGFSDWLSSVTPISTNVVVATMPYINTPTGQQNGLHGLYYMEVGLQAGKTIQSVTLPATVSPGQLHVFAVGTRSGVYYNNAGTSDDNNTTSASFDNGGNSYSAQALQAAGLTPGQTLTYDGIQYSWPTAQSGTFNNYVANGQTIPVTPVANATTFGFLGSSTQSSSSGTATITYTDGSTQAFTLGLSDWRLAANTIQPSFGNGTVATTTYSNQASGKLNSQSYIFSAEVTLQTGKTLQSITLPSSVTPAGSYMHVFAIGTRAASVYNNVGTSNDAQPSFGNFDGAEASYSTQALQSVGFSAGQTVLSNGTNFTWPSSTAGNFNNYQASGQTIPVTPVASANTLAFLGSSTNGAASGTATITYTNGTTQPFPLGFSDWLTSVTPTSNTVVAAVMPYINTPTGRQNATHDLYYMEVSLQAGKTIQSVTLPATASPGQLHVFAIGTRAGVYYNNVGTSDDNNTTLAGFDNGGASYSAQALQTAGLAPGQALAYDGIQYSWPTAQSGMFNNYVANGQIIPVTPVANANTLGLLGASTYNSASGTATITYTDGSIQTFTLGLSDWQLAANTGQPAFGNGTVAIAAYSNQASGKLNYKSYIFSAEVTLQTGKTLRSVTLPASVTPAGSYLHVFAIGTRAGVYYNNVGISNDANPTLANYDGAGASYSAQALQNAGLIAGRTVTYNGVSFTWPNVPAGSLDNYQATGQTIPVTPVTNANTLAFLGSASYGPSSGTATITYTDGTMQPFPLGFSDWSVSITPLSNTIVAAAMPYANIPAGKQNTLHDLYYMEIGLQAGKTLRSVTLPTTVNQGQLHVFAIGTRAGAYYNNVGTSDNHHTTLASFDNGGASYSAQALKAVGLTPGQALAYDGIQYSWPTAQSGMFNNYVANGQIIPVTPVANANTLGLLGASTYNSASGTATITYTDGSIQTFTLGLSDWQLAANTGQPAFGNGTVAIAAYSNQASGKLNYKSYVFSAEVTLQTGKTLQSVTLPASVTPAGSYMHVFAIGTRTASVYNNVGISDDAHPGFANYDGSNVGYSAQALQKAGLVAGQSVTYNGVTFTWPNVAPGMLDNYQASGQTIPVTPVTNANTLAFLGTSTYGPSSGTATINYNDGTMQTFTLGFTDWWTSTTGSNNTAVAVIPYINTPTGRQNSAHYLYYAETSLASGKTIQSVTLPAAVNQGQLHIFAVGTRSGVYYNNAGISNNPYPLLANLEGSNASYSAQALQNAGLIPGKAVTYNGVPFTWPNVPSNMLDNYQANGQTIAVTPVAHANTLAFIGVAIYGPSSGTATITYTDSTMQTFTLGFTDWSSNTLSFNNSIMAVLPYINTMNGHPNGPHSLFYAETPLQSGKTIQSVTLPTTVNQGQLHVFAIGTRAGVYYNNLGISDDVNPTFANFDGGGASYSAQALQNAGLAPGVTKTSNGVNFTWPNAASNLLDNYQANGQIIPVTPRSNATTLAFLGAATTGGSTTPSSGTATITYTDNSTQTFTLTFSDWTLDGGQAQIATGNSTVATLPYRNTTSGKQTLNTYVFYTDVTLQTGKTVQSVTLPTTLTIGQMHVFAIGTK